MVYRMSWFNSLSQQADEAALYGAYLFVWYTTWSAASRGACTYTDWNHDKIMVMKGGAG
ncbi:hypothetical protein HP456_10100 [Bacillus haikouensis]|uniref:hypothetical protein n=1 Tax=Bacillus haikouensis TaxID=1510468 RepID=UPI0015521BA5|nr:hypothetical protein [Bacillus haikouensis]NQD66269.1 hypothetical protein [Bacillus haikouensis]